MSSRGVRVEQRRSLGRRQATCEPQCPLVLGRALTMRSQRRRSARRERGEPHHRARIARELGVMRVDGRIGTTGLEQTGQDPTMQTRSPRRNHGGLDDLSRELVAERDRLPIVDEQARTDARVDRGVDLVERGREQRRLSALRQESDGVEELAGLRAQLRGTREHRVVH